MNTTLRWLANRSVSCLHAAAAVAEGRPCANEQLAQTLTPAVEELTRALGGYVPAGPFWRHVVPMAFSTEFNQDLAEWVLNKIVGRSRPESLDRIIAAELAAVKSVYATARPDVLDELELRSGPMREQWEARGPGLLAGFARQTEPELLVEEVAVLVVDPIQGGGGEAHLAHNSVRIEAVLANPMADLPEVARLGWLVAMLNQDLPRYSERLPAERVRDVIALATLPPLLEAAVEVELVRPTPDTLRQAIAAWCQPTADPALLASATSAWWQTYVETRPSWELALAALEQMTRLRT